MSTALTKSLSRSRGLANMAHQQVLNLKDAGMISDAMIPMEHGFEGIRDVSRIQRRYSLFRGWLYSAVNALASEAAGQPVFIGRVGKSDDQEEKPKSSKSFVLSMMTKTIRNKASRDELEILTDPDKIRMLEQPNPIQSRWEFVYSFVANLNLTGWAYIIRDVDKEGRIVFYSLPSTWIRPDHKNGPFSRFFIVNPNKPQVQDQKPLDRSQVGFAYLPDPSNPLSALAPAASQQNAIRIDDHIQTSQEVFFENGIFPSVVVTVGKDPHPNFPAGIRPRLTGAQRRQIHGAIDKVSAGVRNYGKPAIIDGLIEKIERFSATQTEMGWEKSEEKVKTRILSAFAVHPYILGEETGTGSYAKATNIEKRFNKRVNTFLDMLSLVMTELVNTEETDNLLVWWERAIAEDPNIRLKLYDIGRKNNDITRNEFRTEAGLPPSDEDVAKKSKLLETVGGMNGAVAIFNAVGQGLMSSESAAELFVKFFDIPLEEAKKIVGTVPDKILESEPEAVQEAVRGLERAVLRLDSTQVDLSHKMEAVGSL